MRHRLAGRTFGRNTNQRKKLFKNLVSSLIVHGEIKTTEARAKAIRGVVDKMIHRAQEGTIAARRVLAKFFGKNDMVNRLVDEIAPAMKDRTSGFTRILHLENRRGDDALLVKMELVVKPAPRIMPEKKVIKKTVKKSAVPSAEKKVEK
ncbi:MAG: 50S ribosomal protein L17 [Candidatus Pacebacteria bacterium RIFCSPHIGHO2_01_FULL_46_10]|nr:MAG: 50S ribosomal protein L17 [Candidatus Pacebacteria bacterium RIFCSPHIGHO2_01_FULL_46_10]